MRIRKKEKRRRSSALGHDVSRLVDWLFGRGEWKEAEEMDGERVNGRRNRHRTALPTCATGAPGEGAAGRRAWFSGNSGDVMAIRGEGSVTIGG